MRNNLPEHGHTSSDILLGVGNRLLATILFTGMAVLIKLAHETGVSFIEIIFYRQVFALAPVLILIFTGPGLSIIRTRHMKLHVTRSMFGLANMTMVFGAVTLLPLAEATTIQFSAPLFATVLAAAILGEVVRLPRWIATIVGFVGILIVAQPKGGIDINVLGIALGVLGAAGTAAISVLLRQMSRTENHLAIVFWFGALSLPILFPLVLFHGSAHPPVVWATLIGVGILGGAAQLAVTISLKKAPVSIVLPIDYTSLIWSIFAGWLLWQQLPGSSTWAGAPMIIGSGLFIAWREHKLARDRALPPLTPVR